MEEIRTWFGEQEAWGIAVRRELHQHPELSCQEKDFTCPISRFR